MRFEKYVLMLHIIFWSSTEIKDRKEQIQCMFSVIDKLPKPNHDLFERLIFHLAKWVITMCMILGFLKISCVIFCRLKWHSFVRISCGSFEFSALNCIFFNKYLHLLLFYFRGCDLHLWRNLWCTEEINWIKNVTEMCSCYVKIYGGFVFKASFFSLYSE